MSNGEVERDELTEDEWTRLLQKIKAGKCTPFLGTDSGFSGAVTRQDLATQLRGQFPCPWPDCDDLARIAQFVATTVSPIEPKEQVAQRIEAQPAPNQRSKDQGHRILAGLPFPIYITTTMDSHLTNALREAPRDVREKLCAWNDRLEPKDTVLEPDYTPTAASPLVYRLFGAARTPDSLVVTEDDYLEFLAHVSSVPSIPSVVQDAIARRVLLFFGYRLEDLEFRVMVRVILSQLVKNQNQNHLSIQLLNVGPEREDAADRSRELRNFLSRYCLRAPLYIRTCWMSAQDFLSELRDRWEKFNV